MFMNMRANLNRFPLPLVGSIIAVLALTLPLYGSTYSLILIASVMMYIVLGLSWASFCVPTNYMSLATAAFFGVGIYTAGILQGLPAPVVLLIGGGLSFLIGLAVGSVSLRLKGMYFCIFTFGISELLRHAMIWYEVNITGTVGRWLPLSSPQTVYYYMLGLTFATFFFVYFLRRSKWGFALQSIGQSEEAAAHMGINVNRVKIISFATTCFFMGAAGAIMATRWSYIDPDLAFGSAVTFMTIMMVLVGGWKSTIWGPVLGATILLVLSDTVLAEFPNLTMLLFGIILVTVIIFLRDGLIGVFDRLVTRYKKKRG